MMLFWHTNIFKFCCFGIQIFSNFEKILHIFTNNPQVFQGVNVYSVNWMYICFISLFLVLLCLLFVCYGILAYLLCHGDRSVYFLSTLSVVVSPLDPICVFLYIINFCTYNLVWVLYKLINTKLSAGVDLNE